MTLELYVFEDCGITFWKKKGAQCASRDIVTMAKLIEENKDDFNLIFGDE